MSVSLCDSEFHKCDCLPGLCTLRVWCVWCVGGCDHTMYLCRHTPVCGDGMFMFVYVCMYVRMYVNFFSNAVASGLWYVVKEEGWSNEYLTTACATIGLILCLVGTLW